MHIRGFRITQSPAKENLLWLDPGSDLREAMRAARAEPHPVVWLLRTEDLPELLATVPDLVVDLGEKDERVGLNKYCLGYQQITVIRATYASTGKCGQGVDALLSEALKQGDHNLFLVALDARWFTHLLEKAAATAAESGPGSAGVSGDLVQERPPPAGDDPGPEPDVPAVVTNLFKGVSTTAIEIRRKITMASRSEFIVLLEGPTGTGKEVAAKAIHEASARRGEPFLARGCKLPEDLFHSLMFGHMKGAFTGALADSLGYLRAAGKGTIFLDEIQELSLAQQAAMLRVLESRRVVPLGAEEDFAIEARIIVATNCDLLAMVAAGEFRADLYYRLHIIVIETTPLEDRPEDTEVLAIDMWRKLSSTALRPEVLAELCRFSWPGNVRQLRNVLESLHAEIGTRCLTVEMVRARLAQEVGPSNPPGPPMPVVAPALFWETCFRHLGEAECLIRVAQIAVREFMNDPEATPAEPGQIIREENAVRRELEGLCKYPRFFAGEFETIRLVKSGLRKFVLELSHRPLEAKSTWKREIEPACEAAFQAILRATERVSQMLVEIRQPHVVVRAPRAPPAPRRRQQRQGSSEMELG